MGLNFEAYADCVVNISGGEVGNVFYAFAGSVVTMTGGSIGRGSAACSGSFFTVTGGNIGSKFFAESSSEVVITGGSFGTQFTALSGSHIAISGGNFGAGFDVNRNSNVELIGGDFKLNGVAYTDPAITLGDGDVFTGTLADGSSFIFSKLTFDDLLGVKLTNASIPAVDLTPIVVDTPDLDRPSGLRVGQTLTLREGGQLGDNFEVIDSTLRIEGGSLGNYGSLSNGMLEISGGKVGYGFSVFPGSVVNISGGDFDYDFNLYAGSTLNLFATELLINGVLEEDLTAGQTVIISQRDVTISGTLADGSFFSFDLNTDAPPGFYATTPDYFDPDATLSVTIVPEPTTFAFVGLGAMAFLHRRRMVCV